MTMRCRHLRGLSEVLALLVLTGVLTPARHSAAEDKPAVPTAHSLQLRPVILQDDPRAIGGPVARFLAPAEWKLEGQMEWDLRRIFNPAGARIRVTSPDGRRQISVFPKLTFTWSNNAMAAAAFPRGSLYLGQEVQPPPRDGVTAITQFVIPRCLPEQLGGARIVQTQDLPKLAEAVLKQAGGNQMPPGLSIKIVAARVRVGGGKLPPGSALDVYAVAGFIPMPAIQSVSWGIDQIVIVQGPAEELPDLFHLYETMAASTRLDLKWFNVYAQVCDALQQMAKDASDAAVVRSRIIASAQRDISQSIRQRYETQQAASDRIFRAWDETIRGVQRWNTDAGQQVELPNEYKYAWRGSDGRYLLTDDGFVDPNRDSNTTWNKMTKAP